LPKNSEEKLSSLGLLDDKSSKLPSDVFEGAKNLLREKTGIPFVYYGFPVEYDPMCKSTREEYFIACDNLNKLEIFRMTHFIINKIFPDFLSEYGYSICESEKNIPIDVAIKIYKYLATPFVELFCEADVNCSECEDENNKKDSDELSDLISDEKRMYFVGQVDETVEQFVKRIFEIEYRAKSIGNFVLFRGTDGINDMCDSPVKILPDFCKSNEIPKALPLSYGASVYSSILADVQAGPIFYLEFGCGIFYALLVDKNLYRKNILSNPDLNLMHIHPYTSIVYLFCKGKHSHPYVKSFLNKSEGNQVSMLSFSPMFFTLFGIDRSPDECKRLFDDLLLKNVVIIKSKDEKIKY